MPSVEAVLRLNLQLGANSSVVRRVGQPVLYTLSRFVEHVATFTRCI